MRSHRWSVFVASFVFALFASANGSARAQWGFPVYTGASGVNSFDLGYGPAAGFSPYDYGSSSFGATGFGGTSNFIGFPAPGYSLATGQRRHTTNSLQSVSNTVTLVPGWNGTTSTRRVRHRH
jgi:hypothetical protein